MGFREQANLCMTVTIGLLGIIGWVINNAQQIDLILQGIIGSTEGVLVLKMVRNKYPIQSAFVKGNLPEKDSCRWHSYSWSYSIFWRYKLLVICACSYSHGNLVRKIILLSSLRVQTFTHQNFLIMCQYFGEKHHVEIGFMWIIFP